MVPLPKCAIRVDTKAFAILLLFIVLVTGAVAAYSGEVSFDEKVIVKHGETVDTAVSFLDDVYVFGTVTEDAVAIGGNVYVDNDGRVNGNAVAIGGSVQVRTGGIIMCDAVSILGNGVIIDDGGNVNGEKVAVMAGLMNDIDFDGDILKIIFFGPIIGFFGLVGFLIGLILAILRVVLMLAVAVLVTSFFPEQVSRMADYTDREFWRSLIIGLLAIVVIPFAAIALLVTIIGIPLIPVLLAFLFAAYLYGSVGVSLWVGRLLPGAETRSIMVNVILGVLVVAAIRLIPAVNTVVKLIVLAVSFGMLIFTRFGTRMPPES